MKETIDLYLISGFLGSGKTTFLRDILGNFEGKKAGVLINEFGNIGIDGRLIEKDGLLLTELNNGSIFCSCLKGDFIRALIEFSRSEVDFLIIENSGMADPSNMHQILDELKGKVSRQYQYRGAVCIVDSSHFLKQVKILSPVQNQIAASNFIVINKTDMVNQSVIKEIEETVRELNPTALTYKTMYSKIPPSVLEQNLADNGYFGETSNMPWDRPATYSLECEGIFTKADLLQFLQRMLPMTNRMKGIVKGEAGWLQADTVAEDMKVNDIQLSKREHLTTSKLVIIGKDSYDFKASIIEVWTEAFQVTPQIYSVYDACETGSVTKPSCGCAEETGKSCSGCAEETVHDTGNCCAEETGQGCSCCAEETGQSCSCCAEETGQGCSGCAEESGQGCSCCEE